jgi:hypothetical protein
MGNDAFEFTLPDGRVGRVDFSPRSYYPYRPSQLWVSVASGAYLTFTIRREDWFDRISKWARLAAEPQIRVQVFDRRYFIECDDHQLVQSLLATSEVRDAVNGLFSAGFKSIGFRNGRVSAGWSGGPDMRRDKYQTTKELARIVEWLHVIQAAIPARFGTADVVHATEASELEVRNQAIVYGFGFAFLLVVIVGAIFIQTQRFDFVEHWEGFRYGLPIAGLVTASLVFWARRVIPTTATSHRKLLGIVIVGGMLSCAICYFAVGAVNAAMDSSKAFEAVQAVIGRKMIRGGGRYGPHYYLRYTYYRHPGISREVRVSHKVYKMFKFGRTYFIQSVHEGWLELPWVEDERILVYPPAAAKDGAFSGDISLCGIIASAGCAQ